MHLIKESHITFQSLHYKIKGNILKTNQPNYIIYGKLTIKLSMQGQIP